jgi:hypothetical protein
MTIDARWVYEAITHGLGDWQSPVMTLLWGLIDPIVPGSMSMFLLMAAIYWGSFAVIALVVSRRVPWLGLVVMLLAMSPPAFILVGMIWRDVLFADVWLCAAALTYAMANRAPTLRWPVQVLALLLVGFGVLLRPNAIIAAPLLAMYVLWPAAFHWKRTAILLIPGIIAGYGLIHVVYYTLLNVDRQNPLHSVLVFDLGGISYHSGENRFPVDFTPEQTAMLFTSACYNPTRWDYYWHLPGCNFVMKRLDAPADKIFGTPRLVAAWWSAVKAHPLAYVEHRLNFLWTFLTGSNLVIPVLDLDHPTRQIHAQNPYFMGLVAAYITLEPTFVFRLGFWLALALGICPLAWPVRATPSGAFAIGITGSAIVYVLSFLPFGVAAEYRYGYWCVLACIAGAAAVMAAGRESRRPASTSGFPAAA